VSEATTLVLRGLSLRLIKSYLVKLAAVEVRPNCFKGQGWAVTLDVRKVLVLKSMMDEIEVAFSGDPAAVQEAIAQLRKKTFRGGG